MMNRKPYMSSSKKLNQTNNATVSNETNMRALDINNLPKHGHNISNMGITHSHKNSGTPDDLVIKNRIRSVNVAGNAMDGKSIYREVQTRNIPNNTENQYIPSNIKMNISNDTSGTPIDVENNWCNLYYYIRCI